MVFSFSVKSEINIVSKEEIVVVVYKGFNLVIYFCIFSIFLVFFFFAFKFKFQSMHTQLLGLITISLFFSSSFKSFIFFFQTPLYFVRFHIAVLVNTIMIMFSAYIPAHGIRNIKKRYVQHYQRRNVLKTVTEVKLKWFLRYDKFFLFIFFFCVFCFIMYNLGL